MAKNSKTESTNGVASSEPEGPVAAESSAPSAPKKPAPKKSGKKTAASKAAGKKSPVKMAAVKKPAQRPRAAKSTGKSRPSDEQIRLRAYFIAERRLQFALGGDPANDWLQAKQELEAELRQSAS